MYKNRFLQELSNLKNLRHKFNRFCFQNRNKGIPGLMLYITLTTGAVYLFTMITQNPIALYYLSFDRELILQGQVWRLFTFPFAQYSNNVVMMFIMLLCYYSLGTAIENSWGTFRFNLFYFSGILFMDVFCMIFGGQADVYYLHLSLFLAYATMYPNAQFLLFFVIPVKAWILALFDLVMTLIGLFYIPFTVHNLFPLIALGNYFLFFGKDVLNVIPVSWQVNIQRLFRKGKAKVTKKEQPKVVPFPKAGSYEATITKPRTPYTHRCTICGRTDVDSPDLEFRYCSRCKGYHCYCIEHINNHTHIQ